MDGTGQQNSPAGREKIVSPSAELGAKVGFTTHFGDGGPPDRAVGHQPGDLLVRGVVGLVVDDRECASGGVCGLD